MDLVCLRSMVLDHLAGFSEEETNFISKVFIQDQSENAELVPNLRKHFTVSDENDPIDDIMSSSVWEKLRASMKESFGQLWHEKCLYFQMPNQLLLALNSRFPLPPPVFDSPADASERRIELIRKGYDCSLIINNLFLKGAIYRSSKKLLRHDYDTILGEIISQDVGVSCTHTLFAAQQKHLRKFCGMNFSISHFRRELQKSKQLVIMTCYAISCVTLTHVNFYADTYHHIELKGSFFFFSEVSYRIGGCGRLHQRHHRQIRVAAVNRVQSRFQSNEEKLETLHWDNRSSPHEPRYVDEGPSLPQIPAKRIHGQIGPLPGTTFRQPAGEETAIRYRIA